jgi:ribosomal protein S18 acetylase RimI-like enzyme
MPTASVRSLTADDLAAFKALRLEALRTEPQAFGASFEENAARADDDFLPLIGTDPNVTFGAFEGDELVGKAGFVVEKGLKNRHKGFMWGVFVRASHRGRGIGEALIRRVLDHARDEVEVLRSAVVATNADAARLYRRLGFQTYGVEPRALKVDGRYFDEELIVMVFEPRA